VVVVVFSRLELRFSARGMLSLDTQVRVRTAERCLLYVLVGTPVRRGQKQTFCLQQPYLHRYAHVCDPRVPFDLDGRKDIPHYLQ